MFTLSTFLIPSGNTELQNTVISLAFYVIIVLLLVLHTISLYIIIIVSGNLQYLILAYIIILTGILYSVQHFCISIWDHFPFPFSLFFSADILVKIASALSQNVFYSNFLKNIFLDIEILADSYFLEISSNFFLAFIISSKSQLSFQYSFESNVFLFNFFIF